MILLIPFTGCKKGSFDAASKTRQDFVGTWEGTVSTFKNNQLLKENGTMVIYSDAVTQVLSGILFTKTTNVFHEFQFVDGTLYFKVDNPDPANPMCQNWSLGGYAVFLDDNKMDIHITGNECGDVGSEFVDWVGTMLPDQVSPDSLKYYNFGKIGNSWNYKTTLKNGDSCQVQKQISLMSGSNLYIGSTAQTCGWTNPNMIFKWNVAPDSFTIVNDSTWSNRAFAFPINAKQGVVYKTYVNADTLTMTLLDTSQIITTPAGSFQCTYFRYTEPVGTGVLKITRTSYIWLNYRYGVIRQEVANPVDSTDVQLQVLSSKNF
jgi:hypothetical protein